MASTNRDKYIAEMRTKAEAYLNASRLVPIGTSNNGISVKETLGIWSRSAKENAEWAEGISNKQFNAERYKP